MGIFYFYNNRKPRKFSHQPILYNPDKEEREERMRKRIRQIKEEVVRAEGKPVETAEAPKKTDFGEEFLSQTRYLKRRKEREEDGNTPFFTNNITIVLILVALAAVFYFVFMR